MFRNILITCVGNICRSPMAEALMAYKQETLTVKSAGIHVIPGSKADPNAIKIMQDECALDIRNHRAQLIQERIAIKADLILAMEQEHVDLIKRSFPICRGKTYLMGKWIGGKDIPDPYNRGREAFQTSLSLIEQSVDEWVKRI